MNQKDPEEQKKRALRIAQLIHNGSTVARALKRVKMCAKDYYRFMTEMGLHVPRAFKDGDVIDDTRGILKVSQNASK